MTLNQLYYFKTVAKYQNYHQASEKLYISQPSLSRSMAALEEELNISLFEKNGRGIVLTKAGLLFLEHAERIINECEIAKEKMLKMSSDGGKIDIAYVFPLANQYMPHKVRRFLQMEDNSNVTFGFYQGHTKQIIDRIKTGQTDVGFCGFVNTDESIEFYPIITHNIVILTPRDHPLSSKDKLSIMELANYPVIGYDRNSWLGKFTNDVYRRLKINPDIVFECPDEFSIQALVSEDFGIALMPLVDSIDGSKVVVHQIEDANLSNIICMVWDKNRYQLPAVNRFIEYMKEQAK